MLLLLGEVVMTVDSLRLATPPDVVEQSLQGRIHHNVPVPKRVPLSPEHVANVVLELGGIIQEVG